MSRGPALEQEAQIVDALRDERVVPGAGLGVLAPVASQQLEHLGRERARDRRIRTLGHHGHHRRCHLLVADPDRDTGAASRRPIEVIGTEAELEPTVLRTVVAEAARTSMRKAPNSRVADRLTFDEDRDLRRRVRVVRPPEHAVGVDLVDREAKHAGESTSVVSARTGPARGLRRAGGAGTSGYRRAMRRLFGGGRAAPAEPDRARNLTAVRHAN